MRRQMRLTAVARENKELIKHIVMSSILRLNGLQYGNWMKIHGLKIIQMC